LLVSGIKNEKERKFLKAVDESKMTRKMKRLIQTSEMSAN
jgi:hypothetical protein